MAKDGEGFIASDIPALLSHTRDVIFLQDREIGVLDRRGISVYDAYGKTRQHAVFHVDWDLSSAEKGGYAHYMLKEIHEQPTALQSTFTPRAGTPGEYGWLPVTREEARALRKSASWRAARPIMPGWWASMPSSGWRACPWRRKSPANTATATPSWGKTSCSFAVSQSGETADTLAALREAKRRGARVMAICNVVGSTITREVGEENTLYTYAGPEIAVASTKAYITQAELMVMLAVALADLRGQITPERAAQLTEELSLLPRKAEQALGVEEQMQRLTSMLSQKRHVFFVGRGLDYALSMEAALKLKEVSYIFSEAYAAGELKHGPIALLKEGRLVVATITQPALLEKTMSNLREVSARGAQVVAVCRESLAPKVRGQVDEVIVIPDADDLLAPLLAVIPLQLFAYCMAVARGCDVDKPRNLAKSVTVE